MLQATAAYTTYYEQLVDSMDVFLKGIPPVRGMHHVEPVVDLFKHFL